MEQRILYDQIMQMDIDEKKELEGRKNNKNTYKAKQQPEDIELAKIVVDQYNTNDGDKKKQNDDDALMTHMIK